MMPKLMRVSLLALGILVSLASVYLAFAVYYWLGWPLWVRWTGALLLPATIIALWYGRAPFALWRRGAVLVTITVLTTAYLAKSPVEQDWVPLQDRHASATFAGNIVTISNFRDAVHRSGQASIPVWTTAQFDLSQLTGLDLIIQPFGTSKATAHILLSFAFSDGRHVVVSMEERQAKGGSFDAIAGFFRRDQLYPELATERDLFWERLSRIPPDNLQIYPVRKDTKALRVYFLRILALTNKVKSQPIFYSTVDESCMTAFTNQAPEVFGSVPVYDIRGWIPGYSLPLMQDLGLVDNSVSAEALARAHTLRTGLASPDGFPSDAEWSAYVRDNLPFASTQRSVPYR